ncbi:MAG: response regulator transcription factor [Gammaproteobacteria bacterium]|nr:response regulator transcription factor [Gammaproteobacteria bacterium]MCP4879849.1 response regulator transcription factor [Gammaproteobacteria bacterium]
MKLVVADDHPLFRSALLHILKKAKPGCDINEVGTLSELMALLKHDDDVDLLLLDLHIPEAFGFTGLIQVLENYEQIPVLVVSGNDNPDVIHKAMRLGASGFMIKSASNDDIVNAVDAVLAGDNWLPVGLPAAGPEADEELPAERIAALTPQQLRVLTMVSEGLYNKQIADELNVTDATVRAHVTEIFRKLGVTNRTQAVILFNRFQVENPQEKV